eukprot:6197378-Pleurochrysis_carterae.AAC.1
MPECLYLQTNQSESALLPAQCLLSTLLLVYDYVEIVNDARGRAQRSGCKHRCAKLKGKHSKGTNPRADERGGRGDKGKRSFGKNAPRVSSVSTFAGAQINSRPATHGQSGAGKGA